MSCELTPAGEELVGWYVDRLRSGAVSPNPYYIEDNGGFYLLGKGSHRVVYHQSSHPDVPVLTADDCVVKIGRFDDPWPNRNEIINWEFAPKEVTDHLAPVHDYSPDGQWLIMEYGESAASDEDVVYVMEQLERAGYHLDDIRPDNVRYVGGEPKIVDYGFRLVKNGSTVPEEYSDGDPEQIGPLGEEYFEQSIHEKEMERLFG